MKSGRTTRLRRASWYARITARALTTREFFADQAPTRTPGSSGNCGDGDIEIVATGPPNGNGPEDDDASTDEEENDGGVVVARAALRPSAL